jgi:hypothetical protein
MVVLVVVGRLATALTVLLAERVVQEAEQVVEEMPLQQQAVLLVHLQQTLEETNKE